MSEVALTPMERRRLRDALLKLAAARGEAKTFCPSEAAREAFPDAWRERMPAVRDLARDLVSEGLLVVTQRGHVQPANQPWRGPIRLRRPGSTEGDTREGDARGGDATDSEAGAASLDKAPSEASGAKDG